MRRSTNGSTIGHAIIFECCKTILAIYPSTPMLDLAAQAISVFFHEKAHSNLKVFYKNFV